MHDPHRRQFMVGAALASAAASVPSPALGQSGYTTARGSGPAPAKVPAPSRDAGTASAAIAGHVVRARYEDIPEPARLKARWRLLDLAGCAIGGIRNEGISAVANLFSRSGGAPEATMLATGMRVPARDAAMANAILSRSYDFEVMTVVVEDREVPSHNSPTTIMTALAMAEREKSSGKDFLTAQIIGDDLAARTLAASGIDFVDGWDGVPLHSSLAAAVIAGKLMKLPEREVLHAMGIAVDQICGTVQSVWDGANVWKLQQGTPARAGILSAEMAAAGWSGMADPLLAPCGMFAQFTPGCARPDLLTSRLGEAFWGEEYFKPYPSCAANHSTIECALNLREANRLSPSDIASVRIELPKHFMGLFIAKPYLPGPSAHTQANFNVRFACANALLRGSFEPEHYDPSALADPRLAQIIARTELVPTPAGVTGVRITVTKRDGTIISNNLTGQARHYPRVAGSTEQDVVAKFFRQVAFHGGIGEAAAREVHQRSLSIDREPDMTGFAQALSRAVSAPSKRSRQG